MNWIEIAEWLKDLLRYAGLHGVKLAYAFLFTGLIVLSLFSFLIWALTRFVIISFFKRLVKHTQTTWDDKLLQFKVFRSLALIFISVVIAGATPHLFVDFPNWLPIASAASRIYIVLSVMFAINALLNAVVAVLEETPALRDKPIRSYKQVAKIVFYLIGFVLILAIAIGQSPIYILGGFGAVTAVLILIFRDPILGFVASIQMSAVDLVRLGDWITVDKYGADGEVIEINLTTIKVRNWDQTITIVPSYAIVSESFRNWRGMEEGDGRRIKRHLSIKISSIRFCDDALFDRLIAVDLIRDYLIAKRSEIERYNQDLHVSKEILLNGRRLTNIGIFRIYAQEYLARNPNINTEMTFMVRQLQPTENGLPLEVYAFSKEKKLEDFEAVAADIFDHLLAAVPFFDLEIFQSPSGSDLKSSDKFSDQDSKWQENI